MSIAICSVLLVSLSCSFAQFPIIPLPYPNGGGPLGTAAGNFLSQFFPNGIGGPVTVPAPNPSGQTGLQFLTDFINANFRPQRPTSTPRTTTPRTQRPTTPRTQRTTPVPVAATAANTIPTTIKVTETPEPWNWEATNVSTIANETTTAAPSTSTTMAAEPATTANASTTFAPNETTIAPNTTTNGTTTADPNTPATNTTAIPEIPNPPPNQEISTQTGIPAQNPSIVASPPNLPQQGAAISRK